MPNKKVKCHECGEIFSTNFCPNCGLKYEDVKKQDVPVTIKTYVHGDKEDGYGLCDEYGIDPKSELGKN